MSFDSMIYTLGTALNRAMDSHVPVELLIHGQWISGQILGVDGHGVILESSPEEHFFVRVEQISVVRVMQPAPTRASGSIPMGAAPSTAPAAAESEVPGPRVAAE